MSKIQVIHEIYNKEGNAVIFLKNYLPVGEQLGSIHYYYLY